MKKCSLLLSFMLTLSCAHAVQSAEFELAQTPIFVNSSVPPLNMLVMGRDHKLYFEAYNDASDLDGDGILDIGYKGHLPANQGGIDYFGYFNSHLCYTYTTNNGGYFQATAKATNKQCNGSSWSGDYLNYLTTSRMDALRKVLYGGYRAVDSTTQTILQGAYIPRDAHSWGKELSSGDLNGAYFDVTKYTPFSSPTTGRHLISVASASDGGVPLLQVSLNNSQRIWDWVSKERDTSYPIAGTPWCNDRNLKCTADHIYNIRVEVCPSNPNLQFDNDSECKSYPNNGNSILKPVGLLHDFGETDRMFFGLLTGSYEKNTAGGVLRSNIDSFSHEIDPETGQFCLENGACSGISDKVDKGIVYNINRLRLTGFEYGSKYSYESNCPWIPRTEMSASNHKCSMWGNPIGEMMYEALRYYAGKSSPTNIYSYGATSQDQNLGLTKPDWDIPYQQGRYASCAIPAMTVISDINPSFDYKLPGSNWNSISSDLSGLNVSTETNAIGTAEGIHGNSYFIGEANGTYDGAPSSKTINNLATVRGLAPEEPTRQGTYYSAGVAKYAAENAIGGEKALYTYAVALASPLPKFEFKVNGSTITLVPFAKTVGGGFGNYTIDRTSTFRPTNSIADFYVDEYVNMGETKDLNINGGRPRITFRVNFEDQEQGADFDMDRLVTYTIEQINDEGEIRVQLDPYFTEDTWVQNVGYVISGTDGADGVYLELCLSENTKCTSWNDSFYALNTPPGEKPGFCATNPNNDKCWKLPQNHAERTFTPGTTAGAELLNDPLWYAAKYGIPGRDPQSVEGDPDNYFLVTNALTLKDQLAKAFNDILQKNASVTRPAVSRAPQGPAVTTDRDLYRTEFDAQTWTGKLIKETLDLSSNELVKAWEARIPTSGRQVLMANPAATDGLQEFSWANLSGRTHGGTDLQDALNQNDNLGSERVDYIKGGVGHASFRQRTSLLGDIVNSNPVLVAGAQYLPYLADQVDGGNKYKAFADGLIGDQNNPGRTPMIYVGANDGMLHGFDATTGEEKFAFIPTPVIENLHKLTDPDYVRATDEVNNSLHQYYVDGSLSVADVYMNNQWRTVLVGTLGAGGRGAFALDITNPDDIKLLWEFTVDNPDTKASDNDPSDLGHIFGTPVIARLHNGKWGVLLNNGYKSPNEATGNAVLFVLNIHDGSVAYKLTANNATGHNGLSAVKAADNNGDGIADYAYAGDLQGNLWRFDLFDQKASGTDPFNKNGVTPGASVSYNGKPLYTAVNTGGDAQPITVQPNLVRHPSGTGYIVIFGTGRYLADADKVAPFTMQSVYGVWDSNTLGQEVEISRPLTRADLQEQEFTDQEVTSIGDDNQTVTHTIRILSEIRPDWGPSTNNCQTNPEAKCGWYLDLGMDGVPSGERMVDTMETRGEVLFFSTRQPSDDPCTAGMDAWNYGINPFTGGRTGFTVFDLNRDRTVGLEDNYGDDPATSQVVSGFKAPPGGFALTDGKIINPDGTITDISLGASAQGRQSWYIVPASQAE